MAKLYKESARMKDTIDSIAKILHDEYEVPAGAGLRIAKNTLYAIANKMDTMQGYFFPLVQNDLWLALNDVVSDSDISKFSYMLWDAHNAVAQGYYYMICLKEEPEIAYYYIKKVHGIFPKGSLMAFLTMEEAQAAFESRGYETEEQANERYQNDMEGRI